MLDADSNQMVYL